MVQEIEGMVPGFVDQKFTEGVIHGLTLFGQKIAVNTVKELFRSKKITICDTNSDGNRR